MSSNKEKNSNSLNIENILAKFFLEKLEMESQSDNESTGKRRKKHKKHKSKKSKYKHKSSRSHSHEKNAENMKFSRHHSSSEEKDFQRLKRLKNIDAKEKQIPCPVLNVSSVHNSPEKDSKKETDSTEIPYGPSIETLFGIEPNIIKNSDDFNTNNSLSNVNQLDVNKEKIKMLCKAKSSEALLQEEKCTSSSLLTEEKVDSVKQSSSKDSKFLVAKETCVSTCKNDSTDVPKSKNTLVKKSVCSRSRSSSRNGTRDSRKRSSKSEKHNRSASQTRDKSQKVKKRSTSRNRSRSRSRSPLRKSKRSRSKESGKKHKKQAEKKRSRSISKTRRRSYSRSRSRGRYSSSSRKRYRSRSRSHDYSRYSSKNSKAHKKRDSSSDYESKSRRRSRSKSCERQRHSSRSHKIDQAKILELAQKNVLTMIEKGTLPEGLSLENFKKEQLVSLKSGGKSVQELTAFCENLSKRENEPPNEKDDTENVNGESDFIHHPFKIKEASTIKLNIKNAVQIPIKTHAEKVAETARLSSQFPVSSGNQHKQKELEWIPVEATSKTDKDSSDTKALVPLTQADVPVLPQENVIKTEPSLMTQSASPVVSSVPLPPPDSINPPLPPPPPPPPLPPVPPPLPPPLPPSSLISTLNSITAVPSQPEAIDYPMNVMNGPAQPLFCSYPIVSGISNYQQAQPFPCVIPSASATNTTVLQSSTVFSTPNFQSKKPVDVSTIVTQRFKALTKLQSDPNDFDALKTLEEAQTSIQDWVQSQQVPGLFTGSTGAKLLSVEELSGPRHWNYRAKKDLFTRAAPVTGGKGMSLLKKMGWNPGEGLGKNKEGSLEPLVLDIKTDKKGLVSEGEGSKKLVSSVLKDLQGKHPVSALMELCSKRKWKPPLYSLISESGPAHKKLFLFKVEVNNVEYHPVTPVNNKKVAKADAAVICLQALNIFPKSN